MEKKGIRKNPTDLEYRLEDIPPTNVMAPLVLQQLAFETNRSKLCILVQLEVQAIRSFVSGSI